MPVFPSTIEGLTCAVRGFGVRQLAAALARASLLAGNCAPSRNSREQARGERVATVSVFLTVGFCIDDKLEYVHLNAPGKGWGIGPRGLGLGIADQ